MLQKTLHVKFANQTRNGWGAFNPAVPLRDRECSNRLFRCHDSVLGLWRIERTALSAVMTRFQRAN
jgi:hypothetical protein